MFDYCVSFRESISKNQYCIKYFVKDFSYFFLYEKDFVVISLVTLTLIVFNCLGAIITGTCQVCTHVSEYCQGGLTKSLVIVRLSTVLWCSLA